MMRATIAGRLRNAAGSSSMWKTRDMARLTSTSPRCAGIKPSSAKLRVMRARSEGRKLGSRCCLARRMASRSSATLVKRLRAAGAVILGKTNLSEWANFRSNHSTSGWSGRGGLTRNPYALDRNACGSSSGSAAAVAANFCAVAVGTETDGSVTAPASVNGIVGIKPTLGLVSGAGIIPIAHSQDTAGPMARTVRDAAILLGALTGVDGNDLDTAASRGEALTDYSRFLDAKGLAGAR